MIVYKLRHIPTGLFYMPTSGRWSFNKTNLSPKGKLYHGKQYPKDLHTGGVNVTVKQIESYEGIEYNIAHGARYLTSKKEDWEVVTYKLVEQ